MKKTFFTILLIAVVPFVLSAQPSFRYGLRGGLNYCNLDLRSKSSDSEWPSDYRLSYHVGMVSKYSLNDRISISPELLFSSKGYKEENDEISGTISYNYLSLPIFINYNFLKFLSISAGPEFNYMVAAISHHKSQKNNFMDFYRTYGNRFDFGFEAGISVNFSDKLSASVRYFHGLSSLLDDMQTTDENGTLVTSQAKLQNRSFQLSFAYLIN